MIKFEEAHPGVAIEMNLVLGNGGTVVMGKHGVYQTGYDGPG